MAKKSRLFRRILAALMVSTSLTFATVALSSEAKAQSEQESLNAYFESGYTYCDAVLLGALWKTEVGDAKVVIGRKVLAGSPDIPALLSQARQSHACTWADTPHNYNDAEALATAWGLPSAAEAKDKIAYLYTQGRSAEVLAALQQAGGGPLSAEEERGYAAFQSSGYTYCDAKLVGAAWSISIEKAKAEIGMKILNGYGDNLPDILSAARQEAQCDFFDTGLSYDDAEKLASVWGVTIDRAKDKAAEYYTAGQSATVTAALSGPVTPRPTPIITVPGERPGAPPSGPGN